MVGHTSVKDDRSRDFALGLGYEMLGLLGETSILQQSLKQQLAELERIEIEREERGTTLLFLVP